MDRITHKYCHLEYLQLGLESGHDSWYFSKCYHGIDISRIMGTDYDTVITKKQDVYLKNKTILVK
jgi:hypothetical protein